MLFIIVYTKTEVDPTKENSEGKLIADVTEKNDSENKENSNIIKKNDIKKQEKSEGIDEKSESENYVKDIDNSKGDEVQDEEKSEFSIYEPLNINQQSIEAAFTEFKDSVYWNMYKDQKILKKMRSEDRYTLICPSSKDENEDNLFDSIGDVLKTNINDKTYKLHSDAKDIWTPKEFGFGESSYFFDFLDDILKEKIVQEFKEMFDNAVKVEVDENDKSCREPKGISSDINHVSICQLKKFIEDNYWITPIDYSKAFLRFDFDHDGLLNKREFILLAIEMLKNNMGKESRICSNCFERSLKDIRKLFEGINACKTNNITSKDIWERLQKLKGIDDITKFPHNIFKCSVKNYRTSSINDFILKSQSVHNIGYVNLQLFSRGILLGYWNRQIGGSSEMFFLKNGYRSKEYQRWRHLVVENQDELHDYICEMIKDDAPVDSKYVDRFSENVIIEKYD